MKGNKIISTIVALTMVFSAMVVLNTMTEFKLVGNASATTGVDTFSGNGSIAVAHPLELLNTSTANLKYAPDTAVQIQVNGSISTWSGVYYLYYPVYSGKSVIAGGTGSYNLTWRKYQGKSTEIGAVPFINSSANDFKFGGDGMDKNVYLNHSGIWLIDNDDSHDMSSTALMQATIPGWFWVNTSRDTLSVTISDNKFDYDDTEALSITVDPGNTGIAEALVAITNYSGKLVGTWNYNQWTSGLVASSLLTKNSTVFNNAGTWFVDVYYDADSDGANDQVSYYQGSGAGYYYYNASTYGNVGAFSSATQYSFALCGPWDPPEYNATTKKITVEKASPASFSVTNTSVYWGFRLKMEVNVTDSDGAGITGGNVSLRMLGNSTYIYNQNYSNIWINETGNGNYTVEIAKINYASPGFWGAGDQNGTFYVYFRKDGNNDSVFEYNATTLLDIWSSTPPVDLKIISDGSGVTTDQKVDVPQYTYGNTAGTTTITFEITGTDVGDNQGRAYYGDDAGEDRHNITVAGDILFEPTDTTLSCTGTTWTLVCTPTKPGGSITISVDWPGSNNGTDTETIYIINGTTITSSADEFTVGQDVNLTFTVTDKWGYVKQTSSVDLFWNDTATGINETNGTGAAGYGADGEYTFWIQPSEQGTSAPKYVVVAANTPGSTWWGYTKVRMARNHDLFVNCTPTSGYAGDTVSYDIEVLVDGTTVPVDEGSGTSTMYVKLYNETGHLVTAAADVWSMSGDYKFDDQEKDLSAGTYYLYAYNDTHDSEGHNATIVITSYEVESNPSVLAWLIDTSENITFSVTPAVDGILTVYNMSGSKNCSDTARSKTLQIINGSGTLTNVNATTLGNLTYGFRPTGGVLRPAIGILNVTTANAVANPATVYIGEATIVEVTVTHPETGAALENIRVGLDHGVALNNSKLAKLPDDVFTDSAGKAQFSITTEASGNITIYIKNGTDPNNKHVIKSAAKKTMTVTADPSVNEGNSFAITIKDSNGDLVTDSVTLTFNGQTYTTTTGTKTIDEAPAVPESLDYTISATAAGYYPDDTSIKVIDVPKLSITVTGTKEDGVYTSPVTVIVYNDNGDLVTGATVTFGTDTGITVGGKVEFTVTNTESKDFAISASFSGFEDAESVTIKAKAAGTPGFELLTLIAAIGVAFILLRRRRQ